jgi:GNAT superfamily N-acetyltransferase
MSDPHDTAVTIVRLVEAELQHDPARLLAGVDEIFFAAAAQHFDDAATRAAFRDLWLGDYLRFDRACAWLALSPSGDVAGYLVGSFDNPATTSRFASLTYFQDFAAACADAPAHLHINLAPAFRSRGIGKQLIGAFAAQVRAAGLGGLHVVTGAAARNVRFYLQAGFISLARSSRGGRERVFLARRVA